MTLLDKLDEAIAEISREVSQLERWADESRRGGWSTHQVEPMLKRAQHLRETAARLSGY